MKTSKLYQTRRQKEDMPTAERHLVTVSGTDKNSQHPKSVLDRNMQNHYTSMFYLFTGIYTQNEHSEKTTVEAALALLKN